MNTEIQLAKNNSSHNSKGSAFVDFIINRCHTDNGIRAALKRADNPVTEYQSWEILANFHINLEDETQRLPAAMIAAALARGKIESNGTAQIGTALAYCYEDGKESDQAKVKLRRLLACDSVPEVCRILRPLLSLIESKGKIGLDYAGLMNDLLWFNHDDIQTRIKARWAQSFYGPRRTGDKE